MQENKCSGKGCKGKIDTTKSVFVHSGCYKLEPTHPCEVCGLLHFEGTLLPVCNKGGHKAFLKNKKVILDNGMNITSHCNFLL
jgi:hypothetical protein